MKPFFYAILSILTLVTGCSANAGGREPLSSAAAGPEIDEARFLDSFGVNIHANYNDGAYARLDKVAQDMEYLGLHHVRTHHGRGVVPYESYARLAAWGLRFNFIVLPDKIDETLDFAARLMNDVPGSVVSIEGFNEINNERFSYEGLEGLEAAKAAQKALYAKVKERKELAGLPVLYFTGGEMFAGGKKASDLSGMADFANVHAYNHNALQPRDSIVGALGLYSGAAARAPFINTEFGNFTLPKGWPEGKPYWAHYTALGVDETTQAKIVLNSFFEGAQLRVKRSYVYELLDEKLDPEMKLPEFHFGLFTFDHEPKASAKVLRNLTRFLDGTTSKSPGKTVEAKAVNVPDGVGRITIRRADGSVLIALWSRAEFWTWDQNTSKPVKNARVPVAVQAAPGQDGLTASVFDPITNTQTPVVGSLAHFQVPVPDYPVLVWLRAGGPAQ